MSKNIELIDMLAFKRLPIKYLDFPDTLSDINEGAFMESSLEIADLSNTKITILDYATFEACSNLKIVKLPETLKVIGLCCFCGTPIKEINLPFGIEKLDSAIFRNCPNLKEIYLPSSLKSIDNFLEDSKIETVYYDKLDERVMRQLESIIADKHINLYRLNLENHIDVLVGQNKSFKEINEFGKKYEDCIHSVKNEL